MRKPVGQIHFRNGIRQFIAINRHQQGVRHPFGHLRQLFAGNDIAQFPVEARQFGMIFSGGIEAGDAVFLIHDQQPAANMHCGGMQYLALFNHAQLGGAAANIDIQDSFAAVVRRFCCARTVCRQHRLHMMASGGANEFSALLCNECRNALRVFATQGLTGQNHHAGIDIVRVQLGRGVRLINDFTQSAFVNARFALIRRQRYRRLIDCFARFDDIAAGKILAATAQGQFGKNDLRTGRADVDANAHQRNVIGDPDRVIFNRTIIGEIVMIVVGTIFIVVRMIEIFAVLMVADRMRFFSHFFAVLTHIANSGWSRSSNLERFKCLGREQIFRL